MGTYVVGTSVLLGILAYLIFMVIGFYELSKKMNQYLHKHLGETIPENIHKEARIVILSALAGSGLLLLGIISPFVPNKDVSSEPFKFFICMILPLICICIFAAINSFNKIRRQSKK